MPEPSQSSLVCAGALIESLRKPPAFWDAFERVKFDTDDSDDYEGDRVVVIVAKGRSADRIAEQYRASHSQKDAS